ncbi:SDR family oxidoreductase [Yinghuangia sp. YIM S09857]|uniref:SDR family oxidoreductase n=1 Tax=Yinghuangia sp. YIM S09857 TaxID=3436929 RepID=UPI003F53B458
MILEGRTLVVSGTGPGLGREIALAAAREGANLVLGARREANLVKIADEVDPSGGKVAWAVTDITDQEQVEALAALAAERFGTIDALVNVAALDTVAGGLDTLSWDDLRRVLETNLVGSLAMTRAAMPALKDGGGAVVFVGTQTEMKVSAEHPQLAYAASKAGLRSAAKYLAHEYGPHRVRVNTVAPGWMMGPPVESYLDYMAAALGTDRAAALAELEAKMALPYLASDGDTAEAVVFLASERARGITGQTILVNAGEHMR